LLLFGALELVIASEAKQSSFGVLQSKLDCFVASLLAMTGNKPLLSVMAGLTRPSTRCLPLDLKDVDARDKPGHDELSDRIDHAAR
jgi:hypothetical protein